MLGKIRDWIERHSALAGLGVAVVAVGARAPEAVWNGGAGTWAAFALAVLASASFSRPGFSWWIEPAYQRVLVVFFLTLLPGSRAVFYSAKGILPLAAWLIGLCALERARDYPRRVLFTLAGLPVALGVCQGWGPGGAWARSFAVLERGLLAPFWDVTATFGGWTAWLAAVVAAAALLLGLYRPRETRSALGVVGLALIVSAVVAGEITAGFADSPSSFLPGAWAMLLWTGFAFRGLRPKAVVIYYAAVSVVTLYLLLLRGISVSS